MMDIVFNVTVLVSVVYGTKNTKDSWMILLVVL